MGNAATSQTLYIPRIRISIALIMAAIVLLSIANGDSTAFAQTPELAGDVQSAYGPAHGGSSEMGEAVHELEMVLNLKRVLAHQVSSEGSNGGIGGFGDAVKPSLTDSDDSVVGGDLHQQPLVLSEDCLDLRDLHVLLLLFCVREAWVKCTTSDNRSVGIGIESRRRNP